MYIHMHVDIYVYIYVFMLYMCICICMYLSLSGSRTQAWIDREFAAPPLGPSAEAAEQALKSVSLRCPVCLVRV